MTAIFGSVVRSCVVTGVSVLWGELKSSISVGLYGVSFVCSILVFLGLLVRIAIDIGFVLGVVVLLFAEFMVLGRCAILF